MTEPYNPQNFNVGHAVFPGYNDRGGLVICGYEWGHSQADQALEQDTERYAAIQTHLAKPNTFHAKAWPDSPYERRILKWFEAFGHPLGEQSGFSPFDKSILQTNWCDDQAPSVSDYSKLIADEHVENFLAHMREYLPSLLIFLGTRQMEYLQHEKVKTPFSAIFGKEIAPLRWERDEQFEGKQFYIGFQRFEHVSVVSLPHPSGTRGLSDGYIAHFADAIGAEIARFKSARGFIPAVA